MTSRCALLALLLTGSPLALTIAHADSPTTAPSTRSVDAILKDLHTTKVPEVDRTKTNDEAYVKSYMAERDAAMGKRSDLIGELRAAAPTNPALPNLLPERWEFLSRTPEGAATATSEIDPALAAATDPAIKQSFRFEQMRVSFRTGDADAKTKGYTLAEQFVNDYPTDKRAGAMLVEIAGFYASSDLDKAKSLLNRVIEKYPKDPAVETAKVQLRRIDGIGKPFELSFTEAITGKRITMADLKGKVVVIDFWATWCGPCVAEMPHNKELYAKFKPQGVEFIGISLDNPKAQGGLDKLKAFVADNQIPWPQYYQGNGWESEFSKSWGINSIPALFVVDADGNLASLSARGELETLLPKLLAKRAAN